MALKDELDDRRKQLPNRATERCESLVMSSCLRVSQYASAVVVAKIVFKLSVSERELYFADEPFCLSPLQLYAPTITYPRPTLSRGRVRAAQRSSVMMTALLRSAAFAICKETSV